jgi:hypothetical protein
MSEWWIKIKNWLGEVKASEKWRRVIFYLVLGLPLPVFLVTFLLENRLSSDNLAKFEVIFQFLIGNWPPSKGILDHHGPSFALWVTFRFTLIYGSIATLLRTFSGLQGWQRTVAFMNYLEMINDRDDAIQNELRGLMPPNLPDDQRQDFEKAIKKAFEEGAKFWEDRYLPAIVGDKNLAAKIIARLRKEQVVS